MLQNSKIKESSGICRSVLHKDVYWTHNDSGNSPVFFAIDQYGKNLGEFPLQTKCSDAEDCSSAMVNGTPTLILGDFGDNKCSRGTYRIYVVTEPDTLVSQKLPVKIITFKYPDGKSRNCEACALLPDGTITLMTKSFPAKSGPTTKFVITSWLSGSLETVVSPGIVIGAKFGTVTGMDSYNIKDVVLGIHSNIGTAFIIDRITGEQKRIKVPMARQREAICFSHDMNSVIVTSEGDRKISVSKI